MTHRISILLSILLVIHSQATSADSGNNEAPKTGYKQASIPLAELSARGWLKKLFIKTALPPEQARFIPIAGISPSACDLMRVRYSTEGFTLTISQTRSLIHVQVNGLKITDMPSEQVADLITKKILFAPAETVNFISMPQEMKDGIGNSVSKYVWHNANAIGFFIYKSSAERSIDVYPLTNKFWFSDPNTTMTLKPFSAEWNKVMFDKEGVLKQLMYNPIIGGGWFIEEDTMDIFKRLLSKELLPPTGLKFIDINNDGKNPVSAIKYAVELADNNAQLHTISLSRNKNGITIDLEAINDSIPGHAPPLLQVRPLSEIQAWARQLFKANDIILLSQTEDEGTVQVSGNKKWLNNLKWKQHSGTISFFFPATILTSLRQ